MTLDFVSPTPHFCFIRGVYVIEFYPAHWVLFLLSQIVDPIISRSYRRRMVTKRRTSN